jgi:hypothetical protein
MAAVRFSEIGFGHDDQGTQWRTRMPRRPERQHWLGTLRGRNAQERTTMINNLNDLNTPNSADAKSEKTSRRGENLSLQDRRRGGKKSASRQTRDGSGKFAGAVSKGAGKSSSNSG